MARYADPRQWPELLHDLVRRFGGERVWTVGIETLEHPPTWATWQTEVSKLTEALTRNQ